MPKPLPDYVDHLSPLDARVWYLQQAYRSRVPHTLELVENAGVGLDKISLWKLPNWAARAAIAFEHGFSSWNELTAAYRSQDLVPQEIVDQFNAALSSTYTTKEASSVRTLFAEVPQAKRLVNMHRVGFGDTPLTIAIMKGNVELVDLLIDEGADPNLKCEFWAGGYLPIDYAHDEMADLLISRGAVLNIHSAARLGRADDVRRMVADDPEYIHARGGSGQTALHKAKSVEICGILLDAGAEIDAQDYEHRATPAEFAFNNLAVLRYLVDRGASYDIFTACALGDLSLAEAVLKSNPNAVNVESVKELWWDYGARVNDFKSGRPLTFAYERKHPELVTLLLKHADAIHKLLYYCQIGDEHSAKSLVARYPKLVSRLTKEQQRTLSEHVNRREAEAVKVMLEVGFDVDLKDDLNRSPIANAAWMGEAACLALLIEHGASRAPSGWENLTPLEQCIKFSTYAHPNHGDYPTCVKLLIEAGDPVPAVASGSAAVMELLRSFGAH